METASIRVMVNYWLLPNKLPYRTCSLKLYDDDDDAATDVV